MRSRGPDSGLAAALWSLPDGVIDVWQASLDRTEPELSALRQVLSDDERDRAARFRFERDRTRYITGRGLLRLLLGAYTGQPARRIAFAYGTFDKPRLAQPGPEFNLSHSGSVALFAFSRALELGIDVELEADDFDRLAIADRFFSPSEVAVLRALPEAAQPRAFLRCWTRKEAFIKARGDGLQLPLDSFDVTLDDASPALVRTAWSPTEAGHWSLHDLSAPGEGHIAALAVRCSGQRLVCRTVPAPLGDFPAAFSEPA